MLIKLNSLTLFRFSCPFVLFLSFVVWLLNIWAWVSLHCFAAFMLISRCYFRTKALLWTQYRIFINVFRTHLSGKSSKISWIIINMMEVCSAACELHTQNVACGLSIESFLLRIKINPKFCGRTWQPRAKPYSSNVSRFECDTTSAAVVQR